MKGLRSWFNEKQLNLLEKLNYHLTDDYDYSDDEIIEIIEAVENYLMMHGFEKDYVPNEVMYHLIFRVVFLCPGHGVKRLFYFG